MTGADRTTVIAAAARAALAVPGVAELQPSLGQALALTSRALQIHETSSPHPGAGVRAEIDPDSHAWHVEVRCVIDESHRALDVARHVREDVRSAVSSHLARHGTQATVAVTVDITRTVAAA